MADIESSVLRTSAILTNSYVSSSTAQTGNTGRMDIALQFTLASLTSLQVKVLFSEDGTTFEYLQKEESTSGSGVITAYPAIFTYLPADWGTAAIGARIRLPHTAKLVKIQAVGNGTLTSSLLAATLVEGDDD